MTSTVCPTPGCPNLQPCAWHRRDPNAHRSPWRNRWQQEQFRRAVLDRAGHACQRCGTSRRLEAHHTQPGNDDPRTGVALCVSCHQAVDRWR